MEPTTVVDVAIVGGGGHLGCGIAWHVKRLRHMHRRRVADLADL